MAFSPNGYLLENSICCGYFDFPDLFAEFAFDEGIETNNRCRFYLFATAIRNHFCDKPGQRRIEFDKNRFSSFNIFGCLFSDTEEISSVPFLGFCAQNNRIYYLSSSNNIILFNEEI